jgi:NitT/TauT family transport system substrate-binding protein
MQITQNRRRFLTNAGIAGVAGLAGIGISHAEPPPETTTVRLLKIFPTNCDPPLYIAGEMLRDEGFTDVRFVEPKGDFDASMLMARDELDFNYDFTPAQITAIDAGQPVILLAGVHAGCLELIANDSVGSITDLKGKRVGVYKLTSQPHVLITLMTAYVGLNPERDIEWVTSQEETAMQLFIDGKVDAFLGIPPEPQELRARKIGHTILNSSLDRPWSQYLCCLLTGRSDYVRRYPVATKRVLRAMLKSVDLCVSEPQRVAKRMMDGGYADNYDYTLQALSEIRYDTWRDFGPVDSLRFYALRMHEAGFIKSSPQKIIDNNSDWRFFEELKRELKA